MVAQVPLAAAVLGEAVLRRGWNAPQERSRQERSGVSAREMGKVAGAGETAAELDVALFKY